MAIWLHRTRHFRILTLLAAARSFQILNCLVLCSKIAPKSSFPLNSILEDQLATPCSSSMFFNGARVVTYCLSFIYARPAAFLCFFYCSNVQTFLKLEISVFYEFLKVWKPIYRNMERLDGSHCEVHMWRILCILGGSFVKDAIVRLICEGSYCEIQMFKFLKIESLNLETLNLATLKPT